MAHEPILFKSEIIPSWEKIVDFFNETNPEFKFNFTAAENFLKIFESVQKLISEDNKY